MFNSQSKHLVGSLGSKKPTAHFDLEKVNNPTNPISSKIYLNLHENKI